MSRGALVLLVGTILGFCSTFGLLGYFLFFLDRGAERMTPEPPRKATADVAGWVSISDLTMVRGLWATEDERVLVSIASRRKDLSLDPESLWPQPWRVTVTQSGAPAFECGLYDGLRGYGDADGPAALWHVGYCKKPGTQETSLPVQVRLLRMHGQEYLRLFIEALEFDERLYPVE